MTRVLTLKSANDHNVPCSGVYPEMCVCIYVNDCFYDFYGYWRLVYTKSQLQETWAYEGLSMTPPILMVSKV